MNLTTVKAAAIFIGKVALALAVINQLAARSATIRAVVQPAPKP